MIFHNTTEKKTRIARISTKEKPYFFVLIRAICVIHVLIKIRVYLFLSVYSVFYQSASSAFHIT